MTMLAEEVVTARSVLEANGYRVFEPFTPGPRTYSNSSISDDLGIGVLVDVETTGADVSKDEAIEFAGVRFHYDRISGVIRSATEWYRALEEPRVPINPDAAAVHGITAADVRGHRFDDERVRHLFRDVDMVIAHNAAFDRPIVQRRFPFVPKLWGCSYVDVPWKAYGYDSSKLGHLLSSHTGSWFNGHNAADDCYAAVHILATPVASTGVYPLRDLITSMHTPRVRVFATQTAYEQKDVLKARGYRWCDGTSADAPIRVKCWWTEVKAPEQEQEREWLIANVYGYRSSGVSIVQRVVDPAARFLLV